jgi:hypothetical protein
VRAVSLAAKITVILPFARSANGKLKIVGIVEVTIKDFIGRLQAGVYVKVTGTTI